jgi:hypothetical protein
MNKPATAADNGRATAFFYVLAFYLIALFLYRVTTPAHEYPRAPDWWMTIGTDILATIGLFGLRAYGARPIMWISILAGIGLLLIRLNGPDSWATGHLDYWIILR